MIDLHEVVIDHSAGWKRWPNTDNTDYSAITDPVTSRLLRKDVRLHTRTYPAHLPFIRCGIKRLKHKQFDWQIDVRRPPPEAVLLQQMKDLKQYSQTCSIIRWRHGYECHRPVSSQLPHMFPLRIFEFGDDCPGSSEYKSFPHVPYFNVLLHNMYIWEYQTGQRTAEKYRSLGMPYTKFGMVGLSSGTSLYQKRSRFAIRDKADRVRSGVEFPLGLAVFSSSGRNNPQRVSFLRELYDRRDELHALGIPTALHGPNWGDGLIEPYRTPEGDGLVVSEYYNNTLVGPNYPMSSLFNTRLFDLWLLGVGQLIYDKNSELADFGLQPGVHYIPFDGTVDDCIGEAKRWTRDRAALANVLLHADKAARKLLEEHLHHNALSQTYLDNLHLLTGSAS